MRDFKRNKVLLLLALIFIILGFGKTSLATDIILNDLSGQSVRISSYKGKPVILFFWTTWCPYCRDELRKLNQLYSQIHKEGIVVFGVDVRESKSKVERALKGYALNFAMLLDEGGSLVYEYGLRGVPTYVFLDKAGQVVSQTQSLPENYKNLLSGYKHE